MLLKMQLCFSKDAICLAPVARKAIICRESCPRENLVDSLVARFEHSQKTFPRQTALQQIYCSISGVTLADFLFTFIPGREAIDRKHLLNADEPSMCLISKDFLQMIMEFIYYVEFNNLEDE